MTLAAWQQAIGMLIAQGGSPGVERPSLDRMALTGQERRWLERVTGTPGFRVTCEVQRWWRDLRLRTAAPLTLAAVGDERADVLLGRYLDTQPAWTQFFLSEAVRFLTWLQDADELAAVPHARSVAAWECARLRALRAHQARRSRPSGSCVQRGAGVAIIAFAAPPEQLFAALLTGRALPAPMAERWDVLVVPGAPPAWRVMAPEETQVLERCRTPQPVAALRAAGVREACVSRLLAEGALEAAMARVAESVMAHSTRSAARGAASSSAKTASS